MQFSKMSGRIFVWTSVCVCAVAVLGDWTGFGVGVAAQHQQPNRQDGYHQSTNYVYGDGPAKDSSTEGNEKESPPTDKDGNEANPRIPGVYRTGVEIDDAEADDSGVVPGGYFDKRGPSSYKLKYGGLGKRKLGSNSLRYGGLGKRLVVDERAQEDELQERELENEKHMLETAYLFLAKPYHAAGRKSDDAVGKFLEPIETGRDTPVDHPETPETAVRLQRSRMGTGGMRYAGLGKRRLKM